MPAANGHSVHVFRPVYPSVQFLFKGLVKAVFVCNGTLKIDPVMSLVHNMTVKSNKM